MLNQKRSERFVDPDQPMVGACPSCGTVVHCRRGDCAERNDPAFGPMPCVGCPKVVKEPDEPDGTVILCGARVYMRAMA